MLATVGEDDAFVNLWNPVTGELLGRAASHSHVNLTHAPFAIAFSPCGRYLAMDDLTILRDSSHQLHLWDLKQERIWQSFNRHEEAKAIEFMPGEEIVFFVATGARVDRCAPFRQPPLVERYSRGPDRKSPKATKLAISGNGEWLASNGRNRVTVWRIADMVPTHLREHSRSPQNGPIAIDQAGSRIAFAFGNQIEIWWFQSESEKAITLKGHKGSVWTAMFTPDGRCLQTTGSDGTARIWDAETGTQLRVYDWGSGKLRCAAFAPDGSTCVAGTDSGTVIQWDLDF